MEGKTKIQKRYDQLLRMGLFYNGEAYVGRYPYMRDIYFQVIDIQHYIDVAWDKKISNAITELDKRNPPIEVVLEENKDGFHGHCEFSNGLVVCVGDTKEELEKNMIEAIGLHLEEKPEAERNLHIRIKFVDPQPEED